MSFPNFCPSCGAPPEKILPVRALTLRDARIGFEVARALQAETQLAEFWRCAQCGLEFDRATVMQMVRLS